MVRFLLNASITWHALVSGVHAYVCIYMCNINKDYYVCVDVTDVCLHLCARTMYNCVC